MKSSSFTILLNDGVRDVFKYFHLSLSCSVILGLLEQTSLIISDLENIYHFIRTYVHLQPFTINIVIRPIGLDR
jgi:hypothetical protein